MTDIYQFDAFFSDLLVEILDSGDVYQPLPARCEVFGIPLVYDRTENKCDKGNVRSWTYFLRREGEWGLTMTVRPNEAESTWYWKAAGDLESARRDLSLLKMSITE